jgi:hypothetical protein
MGRARADRNGRGAGLEEEEECGSFLYFGMGRARADRNGRGAGLEEEEEQQQDIQAGSLNHFWVPLVCLSAHAKQSQEHITGNEKGEKSREGT